MIWWRKGGGGIGCLSCSKKIIHDSNQVVSNLYNGLSYCKEVTLHDMVAGGEGIYD